jgi:hypothetical protein
LIGVVLGIHQSFAIDKEVGSDNANARINNQGAGVGLDTGIADFLTKSLAEREQKSYLNRAYEANFPTDPFGAVMEEVQGKKNDLVLGGIEEIATQLKIHNCSLSQKNISAILYYFNDNFRGNMEYQLLKNSSQTVEIRYTPGAVESACKKFNQCYYTAFKGDVMTDCKEKFTHRYSEGVNRKQNLQTIQTVQVGEDKYRNTSLEDSPYDLMYDISAISKILFESIQDPHQLAFYHLPNRKGNNKNGVGNTNEGSSEGTGNNDGKTPSEN